jgi:hypothetical protein
VLVDGSFLVQAQSEQVGVHGEVLAIPIDGGPTVSLGRASRALGAAEHGRVWLVDNGIPERVRQVDLQGQVLAEGDSPSGSVRPVIAVPGGLVYLVNQGGSSGALVWDSATGRTSVLGSDAFAVADSSHDTIAWRNDLASIHFTNIATDQETVLRAPAESQMIFGTGQFSADGKWFAAGVSDHAPGTNTTTNPRIAVIEVRTASIRTVTCGDLGASGIYVAWSPDSQRLYCTTKSNGKASTTVGGYSLDHGAMHTMTMPFGELFGFVVMTEADAQALLDARIVDIEECSRNPNSGSDDTAQSETCGFHF